MTVSANQAPKRWLLPEGVEEWLPPNGWQIELLRRRLLDMYRTRGYELIMPPLIEYLDSLLTGAGSDLELRTFKLTDQLTGRMMGVRADVTPQAARIDANRLADVLADAPADLSGDQSGDDAGAAQDGSPAGRINRLCYIDSVLRTVPETSGGPRTLRQVGCELFGHDGPESDLEVIDLMLATLSAAGVPDVHLDLGHVGVFRALAEALALDNDQQDLVLDLLQRKSAPDLAAAQLPARAQAVFTTLMRLNGGADVIAKARGELVEIAPAVGACLDAVEQTTRWLAEHYPDVPVHIDLAELRGLRYHTGLVFGAFIADHGRELARGGRYNNVGAAFGAARAATGFSANLHDLLRFGSAEGELIAVVLAPANAPEAAVAAAREAGHSIVRALPGANDPLHTAQLVEANGEWVVQAV